MKWTLEKRNPTELREFARNPRILNKHDAKHLQESIKKYGQCEPLVINRDNTIIGGHQRLRTLKNLKYKEVDVYVPHSLLGEKEVEELNIRLNRNNGEWDYDMLANAWDTGNLLDWGFLENEFSIDMDVIEASEADEEQEQLEPPKDPKTKLGDVYQLGHHRLVCGDSTKPEDVEKLLDGAEPILMITDPPYGVEYDPSWRGKAGKGQRANGKVQNDDKINWSLAWSLFPGNVAYVWHAAWFSSEVHKSLLDSEYKIICQIIWVKQHFAISRGDYHWKHEPCWYAVRKGQKHNWQGSRKESTVWEISNLNAFGTSKDEDGRTAHSTQKPLECMARPIRNNTKEGEGVYDPFVGSGTTLIAADRLMRIAYCMELSPAYCDIVIERWIKEQIRMKLEPVIIKNGLTINFYELQQDTQ